MRRWWCLDECDGNAPWAPAARRRTQSELRLKLVFACRTMHLVVFYNLLRAFRIVAIETNRSGQHAPVFGCRVPVDLVTTGASHIRPMLDYVACIAVNMAVTRIEVGIVSQDKIHLEIFEQV